MQVISVLRLRADPNAVIRSRTGLISHAAPAGCLVSTRSPEMRLLLDSLLIQTCLLWEHGSDPHQPSWILMSSTMPPVTQCMPELDTCLFIPPRMPFSRSCWAIKDMSALASLSLSSVMSLSFLKEQDKRFQRAEVWRVSSLTLICIWRAGQVVLKSTSNYRPVQVSWSAVELGDDLRCNHTRKSVHISATQPHAERERQNRGEQTMSDRFRRTL